MTTLLVDNHDSFTFNIVQILWQLGESTIVLANDDRAGWEALNWAHIDRVVVSPGPGTPHNAADLGFSLDVIVGRSRPLLGVCLGHQALCTASGARVVRAPEPMHGRVSRVHHNGDALFAGVPVGFDATRYHSLIAVDVPVELECIAWSDDGHVMGVRHRDWPAWGVQFHPESIGSPHGMQIIANFVSLTGGADGVAAAQSDAAPRSCRQRTTHGVDELSTRQRKLAVHWVELDAVPDPVTAMSALFPSDQHPFWIDTLGLNEDAGQFSYLGVAAGPGSQTISYRVRDDFVLVHEHGQPPRNVAGSIFDYLAHQVSRYGAQAFGPVPFNLGFVGWLGYELRDLGGDPHVHRSPHPDAFLVLADRMLVIEHTAGRAWLAALDIADDGSALTWIAATQAALIAARQAPALTMPQAVTPEVTFRHDLAHYRTLIDRCQEHIRAGESYELCLTNQMTVTASLDPFALFRILREQNPAPFSAYVCGPGVTVVGSSPERFLTMRDGRVRCKPMKGTRARGIDEAADRASRKDLSTSTKERAENLMITDLVRNDVGSIAQAGTVSVETLFGVETYPGVHQMVSTVTALVRPEVSTVDALQACFPGGSMTGAPKRRATEILDVLEGDYRGIYSGALGFISFDDTLDLSMVIRTAIVTSDTITVGIGGAITALSDPDQEVAEILLKGQAVLRAVATAIAMDAD